MCLALGQMDYPLKEISKPSRATLQSSDPHVGDESMKPRALLGFACVGLAACETPPSAPTSQTPVIPPPSFATSRPKRESPGRRHVRGQHVPPEEVVDLLNGFLTTSSPRTSVPRPPTSRLTSMQKALRALGR